MASLCDSNEVCTHLQKCVCCHHLYVSMQGQVSVKRSILTINNYYYTVIIK